jgi:predicted dehydrogenase
MPISYLPEKPGRCFPILIIGAGGIVKDAHLPAYRLAGFPVWGLYNRTRDRADAQAKEFEVANVFNDLDLNEVI